jgi:hypothetical protein
MQLLAALFGLVLLPLVCIGHPVMAAECLEDIEHAVGPTGSTPPSAQANDPKRTAGPILRCFLQEVKELKQELSALKQTIYDTTDEVYTISHPFTPDDLKDANHPLSFVHYIYADPSRHHVTLFLLRRDNNFTFNLTVNEFSLGTQMNNLIGFDLTPVLKTHALKTTRAGVDVALSAYPPHVQKIEMTPTHPNWDEGQSASLDGYVLVQRAEQAQ